MTPSRLVFAGTYTEPILFGTGQVLQGKGRGIYMLRLNVDTGALEPCGLAEGVINPSYLAIHPSGRFLYAVNELKQFEGAATGSVSAFALDGESGTLAPLNKQPTHGTDPCHLAIDPSGKWLLVANFASGSVCVLPIREDGWLGDPTDVVRHHGSSVDPRRQAGPHAHAVTFDRTGRYVFVPDLGMDKVMVYDLDAAEGKLAPNAVPWFQAPPGSGPRQLVMHPAAGFAYLINELDSTMMALRVDLARGALHEIQTLSTLPDGYAGSSFCAEAQITPSGRFLYGSNRGHDSIVMYAVNQAEGTLTCIGHESTQGRIPRNFTVDPGGAYVLVANQDSDNIVVFSIDGATGRLIPTGHSAGVPTPVCVKVL